MSQATIEVPELGPLRFERRWEIEGIVWNTKTVLSCHEQGVAVTLGKQTRRLAYADLEAFGLCKTVHYQNGWYVGTEYQFRFRPLGGAEQDDLVGHAITKPLTTHNWIGWPVNAPTLVDDPELERLRDEMTDLIVPRMLAELRATGSTAWTPHLRLTREGVEPLRGTNQLGLVPFADVERFSAADGLFSIQYRGQRHPIEGNVGALNFYPGLAVFNALLGARGASQEVGT
jgi:hypothetical protein